MRCEKKKQENVTYIQEKRTEILFAFQGSPKVEFKRHKL